MSRKTSLVIGLGLLAGILLAADGGGWWFVTSRMEAEAAAWQHAQAAQGWVVQAGTPVRSGWPLRGELVLPGVTLATGTPGQRDAIAWQTDQVRLVYEPWHPAMMSVVLDGQQTIRYGTEPPVNLDVERLDVNVPLDRSGQAQGVAMAATGVSVPLPGGPLRIRSLSLLVRTADRGASTLLGLMSRPGASDVAEAVLPVTLRDRTLSVGAIPLLRLPALALP